MPPVSFHPLPDPLPGDPLAVLEAWLREAREKLGPEHRNPTAMTLATSGEDHRPDARVVLCRGFDAQRGVLTFYTDRTSTKGRQLSHNPHAAGVFYWEELYRQVRVSGPVTHTPDDMSDAYFASRPFGARVSATISRQSQPLATREELERLHTEQDRLLAASQATPRPERWGGYDLWIERIEFWVGRIDRLHDRARYERSLPGDPLSRPESSWRSSRLQP